MWSGEHNGVMRARRGRTGAPAWLWVTWVDGVRLNLSCQTLDGDACQTDRRAQINYFSCGQTANPGMLHLYSRRRRPGPTVSAATSILNGRQR